MAAPLLEVEDLTTHFFNEDGVIRAVDGLSLSLHPQETLGIVGESGCGKTVTALSILRLLPTHGRIVGGRILFAGTDLVCLSERQMRAVRGNRIAMIFQEPMTSLNPVLTVGHQIAESVRIHKGASAQAARLRAREMLEMVKIPDAASRLDDFPHQFSGGMRQRVVVMYAGRKVEEAPVAQLFARPAHPYTRGLIASIARGKAGARARRLNEIPGMVPSLREPILGCAFAERCTFAFERCHRESPRLRDVAGEAGHRAACLRLEQVLAS